MSPSEYPRPTSRDGVATPDTQPNTTGKVSITTLIRIRQEKIMFSFQNKKVLLLRSMLVRTPAIRPNAAAEIHLFTASVADRMKLGKGKLLFYIRPFFKDLSFNLAQINFYLIYSARIEDLALRAWAIGARWQLKTQVLSFLFSYTPYLSQGYN